MLSKREGLMLYWCEGDKYTSTNKYKVAVTSTDISMVRLFVDWLEKYYNIDRCKIRLRLHLWDATQEKRTKTQWANKLGITIENFTKSWIKKRGSGKRIHEFGLCRASIDSKDIFQEIMNGIKQEFYIK